MTRFELAYRGKAAAAHLVLSALIGVVAALLIFRFWFPWPYREVSGGRSLFLLIVSVDVVIGPLLTFVVFNRNKPRAELVRDVATIAVLQLAALCYGIWTLGQARPVHMVFEVDRFRVVSMADIDPERLHEAPEGLRNLPWTGPTLIAVRRPQSAEEVLRNINDAMQGQDLSTQPRYWIGYDQVRGDVARRSHPLSKLIERKPAFRAALEAAADEAGRPIAELSALPLLSRFASWVVLLDTQGNPVGYVAVDGF